MDEPSSSKSRTADGNELKKDGSKTSVVEIKVKNSLELSSKVETLSIEEQPNKVAKVSIDIVEEQKHVEKDNHEKLKSFGGVAISFEAEVIRVDDKLKKDDKRMKNIEGEVNTAHEKLKTDREVSLNIGKDSIATKKEIISAGDILTSVEEETLTRRESTSSDKQFINNNDLVIINIEEEDEDNLKANVFCDTEKKIEFDKRISRMMMHELIHLDDDNPDRLKNNIQPTKSIWAYANFYSMNRVEPQGGSLDYDGSRNGFLKIVFSLLILMLAVTASCAFMVYSTESLKNEFKNSKTSIILVGCAAGVMFIIHYAMLCSECTRRLPCNIICLIITTLAMSIIVSCIIVKYKVEIIIIAIIVTAGTIFFCFLLACSSFDFTRFFLYFIVISVAFSLLVAALVIAAVMFNVYYKPLHIGLLIVSTILTVISIIIKLQMVLGGRAVEIGEDDYALAAYMLYLSIIDLFLNLVKLLGLLDDDD